MAAKTPAWPNNPVSLTNLEEKFLTCSTVDFPKSSYLVIYRWHHVLSERYFAIFNVMEPHGGSEPRKVTDDVLQRIKIWKLQNEYGYRVQYSNNQSVITFSERLAGSMFK